MPFFETYRTTATVYMPPLLLPNESAVRRLMQAGVDEGVFPGSVLLVARGEDVLLHDAWGVADCDAQRPVRPDTAFDLASLTKPLATAVAVMRLVRAGRLGLDAPLARLLPIMGPTDKAEVTVRQLLSHSSGWPAWQPYFERLLPQPPEERRRFLAQYLADEPLVARPGETVLYSDIDFLALGLVVEACTGERLDRFVRSEIYQPLGIRELFFNPLDEPPQAREYAATESCPWRGRVLCGEVHDDNAHALNGVAGHAGLFGTVQGVFDLLRVLLRGYEGDIRSSVFSAELVRAFWSPSAGTDWALGFDRPSAQASSSGRYFSANTIGHLGFTGTSFWLDIDRRLCIILLTNRVHPSRDNVKIKSFRPRIHDEIMAGLVKRVV